MNVRSVRARLTVGVSAVAAAALAALAIITPGIVTDVLETDLIESEAQVASFFVSLGTDTAFSDDDFLRGDDGELLEVFEQSGGIGDVLLASPTEIELQRALEADAELEADYVEGQIDLLQTTGGFATLVDAADGSFALESSPAFIAIVEPDGTFTLTDSGDAFAEPLLTDVELNDFLFDDLGIFQTDQGSLVAAPRTNRLIADVTEVDGLDVLVVADATSIDVSINRIRTGLWVAVPLLTLVVAGLAWALASRALRPVRSITDQAATISGGSLDARVPVPESGDEVATLATTVNEMLDRLEHDDRSRRRFISDASHELRSPVAVMRNEAEVALHHPGESEVSELAATVADESKRMATIIDDLLALARHDEGVPRPDTDIDLDDIVLAEAARTRRVPVDASNVSAGRVRGRADELGRMVGHLLDNAARHATTKVSISLRTTTDDVQLVVDDDGPGVAPEARELIFERFARLDEARTRDSGGAGLGLAVVRGIAQRSGGTVAVTDAPGGGARFSVTFTDRSGAQPAPS